MSPKANRPEPEDSVNANAARRAAAFDAMVADHCDRLCRFVYRYVGSREEAEDVVQEVFLAIWERGYEWEGRDPLPFLYKAAHNRAISRARHESVHERWQLRASTTDEPTATTVDTELAESELADALACAIERLPERCRRVFTMSREQGLSHAEIARVLGLSQKTVESHIWRALTYLRASLAPYLALLVVVSR
jgi:RNA polymerase sigma-70 factor (ECF subfamily)